MVRQWRPAPDIAEGGDFPCWTPADWPYAGTDT